MNELFSSYLEDFKDNIIVFNKALMEIETGKGGAENINNLFRVAHTIKGNSGAMEFKKIEKVMHTMENILQDVREGNMELTRKTIDILYDCHDLLEDSIKKIALDRNDENVDINCLLCKLNNITKSKEIDSEKINNLIVNEDSLTHSDFLLNIGLEQWNRIEQNIKRGMKSYKLDIVFSNNCEMKGLRAWLISKKIDNLGIHIYSKPSRLSEEELAKGKDLFEGNRLQILIQTQNKIDELVRDIEDGIDIACVKYKYIDMNDVAEYRIILEKHCVDNNEKELNKGELMRIPVEKVDNLIDMLGEVLVLNSLLEQKIRIEDELNTETGNIISQMVNNIKAIQNLSISLRMVEIKTTLHKLTRIARDIASKNKKEVVVTIKGEETEIDRSVAERLFNPLMHLVRNAVSHGIETKEDRVKVGKSEIGEMAIEAYNKSGNVYIKISDDGIGIDTKKVLQKAIELSIANKNTEYSENEIIDFIFLLGLSTQKEINNISGRGVGLNVVKEEIKKMNGKVEVRNNKGKGCSFIVSIPMKKKNTLE